MADYSINAVTRRVVFTGSAGVGPYAFSFEILDQDDVAVYFNTTLLTLTTDYTVTVNANGTGSVTIVTGTNVPSTPTASDTIIIIGSRDIERVTDFVTAGDLLASSLNEQLDALTIFDQQIAEEGKRSMRAPVYDPALVEDGGTLDMTLPPKADRVNKTLAFNATTGNPEAGPTVDEVSNAQANATAAAASATAAASSATAAASSATSASTAQAAAETAQTAAETAETNAETAETNAETAQTAAETAQTAAETAETNAATSATNAATSESNAATSATNAATSASNASTSETNAATSATAAATSATAAASSQVAAAASAASAASAFDNFDDTYLGSAASDPSVDNDGDPLTQGDLYFNSTANEMRVYDGANWIAASSAGGASLILYEYTATSGQTTFSGSDDNAATLSYTADNIQVVMNGIVLDPSDFTATNGTSVVLASGAAANDILNIYAFKSFTVADTVSASAGGTFSGNVAMNGDLTVDTNTLYVDSTNNRVGVGTTSPARGLHLNNNGESFFRITSSDTGNAGIEFGDQSDGVQGAIFQNSTDNSLRFNGYNNSERMRLDSSGTLMVGGTVFAGGTSMAQFEQSGTLSFGCNTTASTTRVQFFNGNGFIGNISTSGSSTSYSTSSDYRLKENVVADWDATTRLKQLNPVRFNFIADADTTVDGFLAHEVQSVVPEAISGTKDEVDDDGNPVYQGVDQSKLVPLLVKTIQELEARIVALENA